MSDLHAQFKQFRESELKLALDIDAAEAAGADPKYVERARGHLKACLWLIAKGIGMGVSGRDFKREHGVELPTDEER